MGITIEKDVLVEIAQKYLQKKELNDAAILITSFKLSDKFDIEKLVIGLINDNYYGPAKKLLSVGGDKEIKVKVITTLSTRQHNKTAFKLVKDFDLK